MSTALPAAAAQDTFLDIVTRHLPSVTSSCRPGDSAAIRAPVLWFLALARFSVATAPAQAKLLPRDLSTASALPALSADHAHRHGARPRTAQRAANGTALCPVTNKAHRRRPRWALTDLDIGKELRLNLFNTVLETHPRRRETTAPMLVTTMLRIPDGGKAEQPCVSVRQGARNRAGTSASCLFRE